MTCEVVTRFCPLTDRNAPHWQRPVGALQLALRAQPEGPFFFSASRTPTTRAPHRKPDRTILDGLTWLGLEWDGEAISQSTRADRHREIATRPPGVRRCLPLLRNVRRNRRGSRQRPGRTPAVSASRALGGTRAPASRTRRSRFACAPPAAETPKIDDAVQGRIAWQNTELDDLILLRSDGSPTYMLAVVVDDHDMQVSHVIRGTDHLTNAARQSQIFDALGWPRPAFAHVPLIHGPDGAKYSKRHGAVGLGEFEAQGYLPEAMRNYLVRLGWSHGDQEFLHNGGIDPAVLARQPETGRLPASTLLSS